MYILYKSVGFAKSYLIYFFEEGTSLRSLTTMRNDFPVDCASSRFGLAHVKVGMVLFVKKRTLLYNFAFKDIPDLTAKIYGIGNFNETVIISMYHHVVKTYDNGKISTAGTSRVIDHFLV
jgi:hypothetical protein